jgi:FkbM family methyltransferase
MQRNGFRGGYRLERVACARGSFDVVVRHRLGPSVSLNVPLAKRSYDRRFIQSYEWELIDTVSDLAKQLKGPITLIDGGADIGVISAKLVSRIEAMRTVVAFEPNAASFSYLETNIKALPIEGRAINAAVADFAGSGRLETPSFDHSEHSAFLVPDSDGPIRVMKIDDLEMPPGKSLVIKLDVEGGEASAVRGAQTTLKTARDFVVVFEAHRDHVARNGVDPMEVVALLTGIRKVDVTICERPKRTLRAETPFFEQIEGKTFTICASTV